MHCKSKGPGASIQIWAFMYLNSPCVSIYIYIYMKVNFSLNDKNIMFYFLWDKNINVKGHKKCLNYKN